MIDSIDPSYLFTLLMVLEFVVNNVNCELVVCVLCKLITLLTEYKCY